jgi:hypothetical protein
MKGSAWQKGTKPVSLFIREVTVTGTENYLVNQDDHRDSSLTHSLSIPQALRFLLALIVQLVAVEFVLFTGLSAA